MSAELSITGSLSGTKAFSLKNLQIPTIQPTLTGSKFVQSTQSIPTTANGTAINLGPLSNVGWYLIVNRDATNFVQLYNATSGTKFAKLLPGEFAMGRFDTGITAPAAIADTAACLIEYLIFEI